MSELPPSREVRLEDGVTHGFSEAVAMTIYSGGTQDLLKGMAAIELTIESQRANAARELARRVMARLTVDGYIVVSDIEQVLEAFLEDEVEDGNN